MESSIHKNINSSFLIKDSFEDHKEDFQSIINQNKGKNNANLWDDMVSPDVYMDHDFDG